MSKLIPLTKGYSAIVDDDDYDYLMQWKWHVKPNTKVFYAIRNLNWSLNGHPKVSCVWMHRELIGISGLLVDHINRDGLDNRRANLRLATKSQNGMNSRDKRGTSRYKGVSWENENSAWYARITIGYRPIFWGRFQSEEEAARAYDAKAIELFGEFANLNFTGMGVKQ